LKVFHKKTYKILLKELIKRCILIQYKMKKISLKINGKTISTESGKTILDVAMENGIDIPYLCYHPDIKSKQRCEISMVEINGSKDLKSACDLAEDGMEIVTDSAEIREERLKNLNLILKKHHLECDDCVFFRRCKLLELVSKFKAKPIAEQDELLQVLQSGSIVFDQTKCIGCENCIDVCPVNFLSLDKNKRISLSLDEKKNCTNCGQCILHCPVGAIEGAGEFEELTSLFTKTKSKVMVVQFAPAVRTSIGEEFGMKPGEIATGKLVAGLKKLGFNYVFDTATGADFTTMEESDELVERIQKKERLPAMSSCCPAWVVFLEFNYPEFISNLCTSRSPQTMLGGIIKNYWAKTKNIDPKNVYVVSVMPCVAKKFEIQREELKIDDLVPVDCVLTTRELARLFKSKGIDLNNIKEEEADDPLGFPSGAGVIYGTSGGVFESAFRTAYFKMTGKELPQDAVKEIRGIEGLKIKEIKVGNISLKVCVANGLQNTKKVLEELKGNPQKYDAIEVMACPGGCVGGGGQLMPSNREIIKKRSKSLYSIDQQKEIKAAHNNPAIKKIYSEFFTGEEIRKKILHTNFSPRGKTKIRKLNNSKETI
jgi:iron-only hydrogenase group A